MWSRDSQLWNILGALGIVLGVVAAVTDPAYLGLSPVVLHWVQILSLCLTALFKFSNSPAPGKNDDSKITLPYTGGVVIILAGTLAFGSVGCTRKHVAVQADQVVYALLSAAQDTEMVLHKTLKADGTPIIGDADHRAFNAKLAVALRSGKAFNLVLRDWPAGTPAPAALVTTAIEVSVGVRDLLALFPDSPPMAKLRDNLQSVLAVVQPYTKGA